MFLHPPRFWYNKSPLALLLLPFSIIYYVATQLKTKRITPYKASVPVICVGNVTVGGTGKTPIAVALAQMAIANSITPCFLSRGYGGSLTGPVKVSPIIHTAKDVGDEPLLLATTADTWVCRDRTKGADAAIKAGAKLIIMDDGFQNPALFKDISLLVIDGSKGFGNGYMLPAGPLREPLSSAFQRANMVIVMGDDEQNLADLITKPIINAKTLPQNNAKYHGKRYLAFAGIGNPSKFFTTLKATGAIIVSTHAFPDHYPYTAKDIAWLQKQAMALEAQLITTEKDAVRLPPKERGEIETLEIKIEWKDEEQIRLLLNETMAL